MSSLTCEHLRRRRLLGVLAVVAVVMGMILLYGGIALADDAVDQRGPVSSHCVKFDFGTEAEGTTKRPVEFPNVEITLDDWYDSNSDPHKVDFTIEGLQSGQYVSATTKSGQHNESWGPYGNGSYTLESQLKWAFSNVVLCVCGDVTTTTTTVPEDTTTTTVPEDTTTTTVPEDTTTTTVPDDTTTTTVPEDTTTTTVEDTTTTTIEDEVAGIVVTTTPGDVEADELPFTGINSEAMMWWAILLLGAGAGLLAMAKSDVEN